MKQSHIKREKTIDMKKNRGRDDDKKHTKVSTNLLNSYLNVIKSVTDIVNSQKSKLSSKRVSHSFYYGKENPLN